MREELIFGVMDVLEFARVAKDLGYASAILDEMDLADDAWEDSIYQLKVFYTECTGELFIYKKDRYMDR